MSKTDIIEIDMVSDPVCPWCWVGLRNLMWAMNDNPTQQFSITFRPFFLDAKLPEKGVEYHAYMDKKFPDKDQRKAAIKSLEEVGNKVGIDFQFSKIKHRPHTGKAHRLIMWAQGQNKGLLAKEFLFKSFFTDGKDIGDEDVLIGIASAIGMDGDLVAKLLEEGQDKQHVEDEVRSFAGMGISAVPTFIVDQKSGISGALPPKDMSAFIMQNKNN
ncbi:MAG: DsbA family oxidoreductase [Robiginitomaculum sp.]|nr:DsbA family oxidoreductase [Robiginitomaculum sp.]